MNSSAQRPERGVAYLYMVAAFFIVTAGLKMTQQIIQPLLLSVFVAVVAVPTYMWLVRKRIASWLALLIVILSVVALLLLIFYIVLTSLADFTARQEHYAGLLRLRTRPLTEYIDRLIPEQPITEPVPEKAESENGSSVGAIPQVSAVEKPSGQRVEDSDDEAHAGRVDAVAEPGSELQPEPEPQQNFLSSDGWDQADAVVTLPVARRGWRQSLMAQFDPGMLMSLAASLIGSIGLMLSNTLLILLTVVFILLEAGSFPVKLRHAFGDSNETLRRYQQVLSNVRGYLVIKAILSALTGILITIWLWLFGVPFAGLWGMTAFLLNFIPNIGSIIAAGPALIVAWLDLGMLPCVACGAGYFVVNLVIGNIIEPRLMGRGMGLSALVVFCSMVYWGWVLGPVGMLLSVPLTMAVRVGMDCFEDTRWIGTLLGGGEST